MDDTVDHQKVNESGIAYGNRIKANYGVPQNRYTTPTGITKGEEVVADFTDSMVIQTGQHKNSSTGIYSNRRV